MAPTSTQNGVRIVYANDTLENSKFPDNRISNTKYSVLNFIPKNLLEQFGRFMNLYFLLIACLQLWSYITPVDPLSTWGPLIVIFTISAIKEGVDDYHRFLSDKKANERLYYVLRDGKREQIQSQNINVGDIVYLESHDEIPCDLVLLSSSDENGLCYIQTANLDGETDYKTRQAISQTCSLRSDSDLFQFKAIIECATPNADIYRFDSRLRFLSSDEYFSLSDKQLLLQATHLKNIDYVYGVAVYTGNETKVGKNKTQPPNKWTKIDSFINKTTIFIFGFQLSLVIVFGILGNIWRVNQSNKLWYIDYGNMLPWYEILVIPLRFLLLNSMMIPISLKVTLDIVKYSYAKLIDWDMLMYDEETDTPACATNTSISEDLGQIEYVFSDKTGTLTENIMVFKLCSINNTLYGDFATSTVYEDRSLLHAIESEDKEVTEFFKVLGLCHTVVATKGNDGQIVYKASSPDEEALVKAAAKFKFEFYNSDAKFTEIEINGNRKKYEKLQLIEFTSDRKRMSVLLRDLSTNKLILYTKGADDVIMTRINKCKIISLCVNLIYKAESTRTSAAHLEQFARQGLRTLCIAYREISDQEYKEWLPQFIAAQTSLNNRDALISEAAESLECNLTLLGVSAIEDKLQDKVPETIQSLRDAGIKVWMLTGDKYTTAVQIANSCNLLSASDGADQLLVIKGDNDEEILECMEIVKGKVNLLQHNGRSYSIIIEGKYLPNALNFPGEFLDICLDAASVICCRVTPQQKAKVVKLVKEDGHVTLSIGDGGNDVVMIQEANVGVGIAGREGLQAARAADYSFAKFKFLKRLLLIHGRYSYVRTAFVSQYCFYKSMFICFIQILYCFLSGFAGTSFFNTFSLTTYNIAFTSFPSLFFVLDKDVPEDYVWNHPSLYMDTQRGDNMTVPTVIGWGVRALYQALAVFIIASAVGSSFSYNGTIDYASISIIAYTSLVVINSLTVFFESKGLTWVNHAAIWGTLVAYSITMTIVNEFPNGIMYQVVSRLRKEPIYWLSVLLSVAIAIVPVYALRFYWILFKDRKESTRASRLRIEDPSIRLDHYSIGSSPATEGTPLLKDTNV